MKTADFKNQKVLIFGLGLLGGGVATTNWLLKQGAKVTITDIKTTTQLAPSLRRLKGKFKSALGGHNEKLIQDNDWIVINPDVPLGNKFVELGRKLGKNLTNEATLFFEFWGKPIVGVTGTRGKTTTTAWINHLIGGRAKLGPQSVPTRASGSYMRSVATGNNYRAPFLATLDKQKQYDIAVAELPSFLLEYSLPASPAVAVITNISRDHLNRYQSFEHYARTKATIFAEQTPEQFLILNGDDSWTKWLLELKPRAQVLFFSLKKLTVKQNGVYYQAGKIYYQAAGISAPVLEIKDFAGQMGEHNLQNLLAAALAAYLRGISWEEIQKKIATLPQIEFRQQTVYSAGGGSTLGGKNFSLQIINDTTATSPEGGIAAIKRYAEVGTILIAGGTDRDLDFATWAKLVKQKIKSENLILLAGSATNKMLAELGKPAPYETKKDHGSRSGWVARAMVYDSLADCLKSALQLSGQQAHSVILFSPAAKSFEKFKNEYDRGEKFNALVRKLTK